MDASENSNSLFLEYQWMLLDARIRNFRELSICQKSYWHHNSAQEKKLLFFFQNNFWKKKLFFRNADANAGADAEMPMLRFS